ncbi:MAG: hypothetical protein WED07_14020 [Candidatus Freyarchaeum deiterrae]
MGKLEEKVNSLLKSIYRNALETVFSIYSVDKDFSSRVGKSLRKYKFGHMMQAFENSADAMSRLALFLEDYVEGIVRGLEFVSNLALSLGIKEYSEVISQKNKVEELIKPDMIDLNFLKFQMRTTEELIYPQLEKITVKMIKNLESLREVYAILESDTINTFMENIEKQESNWNKIQDRIKLCFSTVEKETDISTCVNQISEVINELVMFAANLRNLASRINQIRSNKLELSLDSVRQFSETIRQLSRNLIILVKCRAKAAGYVIESNILPLTILWGSEENAQKKLQSLIRSEISLEDLIPPSFSLEDLEFGLVQARNKMLLADRAQKRVEENAKAIKDAANYLNSPVLGQYYEMITKEIEIFNKGWPKYNQNVIELQSLLHEKAV